MGNFAFCKASKLVNFAFKQRVNDGRGRAGAGQLRNAGRARLYVTRNRPFRHGCISGCRNRFWRRWLWGFVTFALTGQPLTAAAASQKYQSGDWITECAADAGSGSPDCSIMVPFWKTEDGEKGAFALAVMLSTGDIAIVGRPAPVRAVLHIGKNPPIACREMQYCLFPREQSLAAIGQLNTASVILIDVFTAKTAFKFSLTTRGYQAGLAEIRAWGYD